MKSSHYVGMAAVSLHNRQLTHRQGHKARLKSNAMVKHEDEHHNGQKQAYTCRLVQRERGLLHLSMREAILLEGQISDVSMNDRKENGRGTGMIRINITRQGIT